METVVWIRARKPAVQPTEPDILSRETRAHTPPTSQTIATSAQGTRRAAGHGRTIQKHNNADKEWYGNASPMMGLPEQHKDAGYTSPHVLSHMNSTRMLATTPSCGCARVEEC